MMHFVITNNSVEFFIVLQRKNFVGSEFDSNKIY